MKKKIMFLSFIFIWSSGLYSQGLKITYKASAIHVRNSNPKTDKVTSKIASWVNSITPRINFIVETNGEINKLYYEPTLESDRENGNLLDLAISIVMNGQEMIGDLTENKAYFQPISFDKIKRISMDNFKWSISKEFKYILGYRCYKATGKVIDQNEESRLNYKMTAWFCPELIQGGPTAYTTLPGLILEIKTLKTILTANKIEERKGLKLHHPEYDESEVLSYKEWREYFAANNPIAPKKKNNNQ